MNKRKTKLKSIFEEQPKNNFKVIKTSLKSILKDYDNNFILINNLVKESNDIVITLYQFIRLFILKKYHSNEEIPELTEELIGYFIRAIGFKAKGGTKLKNIEFQNELDILYLSEFKILINREKFNLVNKKYLLAYLTIQIHTSFYNNLKEHFITRFRNFINQTFPIPINNKKDKQISNHIKKCLLLDKIGEVPENLKGYFKWIKKIFLPDTYIKNYGYDVKVAPHKYMYYTIKMSDYLEKLDNIKLFQSIPLRTQIIPKYITLDACCILNLLNIPTTNYLKKYPLSNSENRLEIFGMLFKLDKKVMNMKNYEFKTIQTDGVGVSIIFQTIGSKWGKKKTIEKLDDPYITDLSNEDLLICKNKKLISVDPGKSNLVYLLDENKNKLRYTSSQRRKESYNKKYNNIIASKKFKDNIIENETILSLYNSKTVNYENYKKYIIAKTELNNSVKLFYQEIKLRKFKWRTWIYKRKSEDKFLQRIKDTYGDNLLLCYGDWSEEQSMKFIMPTKGIGLRRLISKKFKTVLIDEFKTSKLCSKCFKELKHHTKENKKIHRLLKCINCNKSDSSESETFTFINRDINACVNILNISKSWINKKIRPEVFKRNQTNTNLIKNKLNNS
jgi:hypothetical protein